MTILATSGASLAMMGEHNPAFLVKWLPDHAAFMVQAFDRLPLPERVARLVEVARDDGGSVVMAVSLTPEAAMPILRDYDAAKGTEDLNTIVWLALWERLPEAWRDELA